MSVHVTSPIWNLCLEGHAKIVLLKFGDSADDDGSNSYPSVMTVARQSGLSRATVQRFVADFVANKVLVIEENQAGGRGLTRHYRVDTARAAEVYGRLESSRDRQEKGLKLRPFSKAEKGLKSALKGPQIEPERASSSEAQPFLNRPEKEARARDPAVPDSGDARSRSDQPPSEPPANLHWKASQEALAEYFGGAYAAFIRDLVPLSDDGETLRLGAVTQFIAGHVAANFGQSLGKQLGRRVEVVHHNFKIEADRRRLLALKAREQAEREQEAAAE